MQTFLQRCPVCLDSAGGFTEDQSGDIAGIDCARCGRFRVTNEALRELTSNRVDEAWARARAEMSAWTSRNPDVLVSPTFLDELFALPTTPLLERVSRLVMLVEQATKFLTQEVEIPLRRMQGVSSSVNEEELLALLSYARSRGWIAVDLPSSCSTLPDRLRVRLNAEGLIELDGKRARFIRSSHACVAMTTAQGLEDAYVRGAEKAIRSAGYEPVLLQRTASRGLPDDAVAAALRGCRFLIIDTTFRDDGMYYEAGFAAALKLPVIWTCREETRDGLPAGLVQAACIFWRSPEELFERLTARIKSLLGIGPIAPLG